MDVNTLMKLMLSNGATNSMSQNTGASADQVSSILNSVMPMLLQGAGAQASNQQTATGFANALQAHAAKDTSDLASFLGNVDKADGAKIIQHLLGGNTQASMANAAKASGASLKDVEGVVAMAAPLLMSILGQQQQKHGNSSTGLLASILGGAASTNASNGIDVGDVLGFIGKLLK